MLLFGLKYVFGFVGFLLGLSLMIRLCFDDKFKNNNKLSPFIAFIGGIFFMYILLGLVLAVFYPVGLIKKIIILLFVFSPFIIGRLVNYKMLKIYTVVQILCAFLSVVFMIFC